MTCDCFIMMANHEIGEIYARIRKPITTNLYQHKELLYRWVDSFLRALDAGEKYPYLAFKFERPVKPKDMF